MLAMWSSLWSIPLLLAFVRSIGAFPSSSSFPIYRNLAMNGSFEARNLMSRQDDDVFDPSDLSFITRLAAIGDSYSAGIGAGDRLGSLGERWSNRRCDQAYPNLINNDERLGDPANRKFLFQSCSGAVIADVIETQIPLLDPNQQVILLSASGNDIGLTKILNQCIYQFSVLNPEQMAVAKIAAATDDRFKWAKDFDFDAAGLGCEGQLDASR
ncbi:SGNH hydrolase-type esterase domain-containing protein [Leptodontidium sp. MPI-SDFR-AT-0119]|nr:SGNH hydrolase-type esterase domain-containing protein [Leptodontidium sp. MPI-SDFR-AT-0119]